MRVTSWVRYHFRVMSFTETRIILVQKEEGEDQEEEEGEEQEQERGQGAPAAGRAGVTS